MYSIPKKEIQKLKVQNKVIKPNRKKISLLVAGILSILAIGIITIHSINLIEKNGNVAGINVTSKTLFEELRAYPEYSKFLTEILETKIYKKFEESKTTLVVIDDGNLGTSKFNIDEYVLINEFNDQNQKLISLSNKDVQMTIDGFGQKKLNDRIVLNEYKFSSGTIIEINRKY